MDYLISMYIDNELSLDEKIHFIEHVYGNKPYKEEAVELLEQEKLLSASLKRAAPDILLKTTPTRILSFRHISMGLAVAACLLLVFSFVSRQGANLQTQSQVAAKSTTVLHRFVIYNKDTQRVEIAGSFTNWQNVPLIPSATKGYWEISLELPAGEHRYTFIVDGSQFLPDPTVATQESDDFGSTNSILKVEA